MTVNNVVQGLFNHENRQTPSISIQKNGEMADIDFIDRYMAQNHFTKSVVSWVIISGNWVTS